MQPFYRQNEAQANTAIMAKIFLAAKAALRLHVKGHDFQAEDIENDLYAAIDLVVDKLDKQVLKYKNKNQEHHSDLKRQTA